MAVRRKDEDCKDGCLTRNINNDWTDGWLARMITKSNYLPPVLRRDPRLGIK